MTREQIIDSLTMVAGWWPRSDLGAPDVAVALWLDELRPYTPEQVETALRRLHTSGRQDAPTAGLVAQTIQVALQGPPPSFDELQLWISRHARQLPYGQTNRPADTIAAIERLADHGAHEALLRFVAEVGVYAARMMPDPSLQGLDPNQSADRRDYARGYRDRTIPDWRRDPKPGRALERARKATLGKQRPGQLNRFDPHGALGLTTGAELLEHEEIAR